MQVRGQNGENRLLGRIYPSALFRFAMASALVFAMTVGFASMFAINSSLSWAKESQKLDYQARDGQWFGLIINPSQEVLQEILSEYSAYTSKEQVESVSKQVANCAQLEHTVIMVNPFELNPYSDGTVPYNINITALSDGIIPSGSDVVLRYLCAGDESRSTSGATFSDDQIGQVRNTYQELSVGKDGNIAFELHGGGVYALGSSSSVDGIEIDPSQLVENVPDVPDDPQVPTNVVANPSNSSNINSGGSGNTSTSQSNVGAPPTWSGTGKAAGAGAIAAAAGAAGLKVADGAATDLLSSDDDLYDEDGSGINGDSVDEDEKGLIDRLFMQGGSIDPTKVALIVMVLLLIIIATILMIYFFLKRRAIDQAVTAAQRAEAAEAAEAAGVAGSSEAAETAEAASDSASSDSTKVDTSKTSSQVENSSQVSSRSMDTSQSGYERGTTL